jgi:PKD repeat protein
MVAFPAFAQNQAASLAAQDANIFSSSDGLTQPSGASAADIVAGFLSSEGFDDATVDSLVQTAEIIGLHGVTHYRFEQDVDGFTVYGTYVRAAINGDGQLIHLIENLADAAGGVRPASAGPRAALDAAMNRVHPDVPVNLTEKGRAGDTVSFDGGDFFWSDPTVTSVAIVMNNGALHEGFLVETWTNADNQLDHTLVGGQGRVLGVQNRTNNDNYKIFADHPGVSVQTTVSGPDSGNTESPSGWLSGSQTTVDISGNNAHAYLDTDNNNSPDPSPNPPYSPVTEGNFTATANLSQEPEVAVNREVAVQNLFYFNNVIHDKLYFHGFTESAGNFQEDNFGNGGNGSDSVNAEAQDGGGTNNANFATPSDGSNPRMQMYVWTQSNPKRDGDLDSDIIWHEYGHGLTWRMIGNMSGSMSGAIGEGMSDVLSILINDDDVVGEYSYNNSNGIRSAHYTNYSRTYGDFTGSSVHFDGEIYAATIWYLWGLFQAAPGGGTSKDTLFDYLIDGMNFTPSGPAFEDMRDGILQAVAGTGHECLIWEAFAEFGVGVGAAGSVRGGGPFGGGRVDVTETFAVPVECVGGGDTPPSVAIDDPTEGETISGTHRVLVSASDDGTVDMVELNINGSGYFDITGNFDGANYYYDWDTTAESDGNHTLEARATDDATSPQSTETGVVNVTVDNVNDPPVTSFTYDCSGLSCDFDATGSNDPDGNIVLYEWDFGDTNSDTGSTVQHTYAGADTYTVILTVTNDDAIPVQDTDSQNVTVTEAVDPVSLHVANINLGTQNAGQGNKEGRARVTIEDDQGNPIENASVTGTFTGDYNETVVGVLTDSNGVATLITTGTGRGSIQYGFCVDSVTGLLPYVPGDNAETCDNF